MPQCAIEEVYVTIQELKGAAGRPSITIDTIAGKLFMNKDLVKEYVTALKLLELVHDYDLIKEEVVV